MLAGSTPAENPEKSPGYATDGKSMALVGNTKDFNLVQLLTLVHRGRKTGCLEIRTKEASARVYFRDGKLVCAERSDHQLSFAEALVKAGRLTQEVHKQVITDYGPKTDKGLVLLLEDQGYLARESALDVACGQAIEVMQFLFTLADADFRFDQGLPAPEEKIPVAIGLEGVIIEGSRQMEEWEVLQEQIPDLRMIVRFADQQAERMNNVQLTGDEWKIITQIDGRSDVATIAELNGINEFRIRKIIFGLMSAGLVRLERPSLVAATPRAQSDVRSQPKNAPTKISQRNVVMRIINRIRGI